MAKKKAEMENKKKVIASANIEDKGSAEPNEGSSSDEELQEEDAQEEGSAARSEVSSSGDELQVEEESEDLEVQEDWPSWMQMVLEGLEAVDPKVVRDADDEDLLAINGVGDATLEEIHAWVEETYGAPERESGKVRIRVRPMRGVGGIGQAGTEADIDREYAEELEADGYVDILD